MILIYRGFGFIVIAFGIVALVAAGWLQATYHLNEHLHVAAMTAVFALLCIIFGQIDEGEGTLFFIPVAYWGYLAVIIPAAYYGMHVYEQKLDATAVKAELTDFFGKGRDLTPTTAGTAPTALAKVPDAVADAAAVATAPAAAQASPISTASASAAAPAAAVTDQYQVPSMALDATTATSVGESPPAAPRIPTFSWSPQSQVDPISKTEKKWLTGTTTLTDGTAVEAKMEEDGVGIKLRLTVDADTDKRKVFVYAGDPTDASQVLTHYRVKIDDAATHQSRFYQPNANIVENEIELNFWDFDAIKRELGGQNTGVNLGDTRAARGIASMFGAAVAFDRMQQYNRLTAAADGTLRQLGQAGSVIVELPLADGSDNFVELDPRDAYVRTFVQEREQQLGTVVAPTTTVNSPATDSETAPDWCPRARRPAEILICNTPQLVADENRMEDLYHSLLATTGLAEPVATMARKWVGRRNSCTAITNEPDAVQCIHTSYAQFIGQLQQLAGQ